MLLLLHSLANFSINFTFTSNGIAFNKKKLANLMLLVDDHTMYQKRSFSFSNNFCNVEIYFQYLLIPIAFLQTQWCLMFILTWKTKFSLTNCGSVLNQKTWGLHFFILERLTWISIESEFRFQFPTGRNFSQNWVNMILKTF